MFSRIRVWLLGNFVNMAWMLGLMLLATGCFLAWVPLGFMVTGSLLLGMATWSQWRRSRAGVMKKQTEGVAND
jgi:hypothetical protein